MADQVIGVTIKGIGDFSDVVSNVGSVQKALTKLKLPDKLGDSLNKNISNFMKEYDKYQKKIAEGIHTQGDQNAVNKSLNSMLNSYEKIVNEFGKLSKKDFKEIFNLDDSAFASVQKRIKDIQTELKKVKIDSKQLTDPINAISKMTSAKALFGEGKGLNKLQMGIDAHDFTMMKEAIAEVETYYNRFSSKMSEEKRIAMKEEIEKLKAPIEQAIQATDNLEREARELDKQFEDIGSGASRELNDVADSLNKTKVGASSVVNELKKIHEEEFSFNREAQNIDRQIQSYFGLSQMIRKVGDIARDAFATVKELDEAMTQTAVVTNFSVGDMWEMLPTYTQQANQLGSSIKDVYEAATLYYQQGLNTNQAMSLANETLKMARIAGLDAADATNMMTAALRGFNMEINQTSAQKINDVYSELAAITASDTREIGSAMERTASIANAANMEFATTSAFLAQMIETTREAPENLGTAMKTIVARFQEMKQDPTKLIDSEGVAMDANKVDKALKTIGVQLLNTKGEFRDLDDVFLDIASRWDSLTQGQQRYIATIAAGSRQQSRFIAMMSNYERTMELVDAANNSAGASQRQFEKTLDSMEAKLNKLKNAWDQFTMGLMNNQVLKFGVDALTEGFTIVNKFIDILGKLPPKPFEGITKSVLTLITTLGMLNFGKKASRGLIMGGAGWWKGETSLTGGFAQGWRSSGRTGLFKNNKSTAESEQQGTIDGQAYGRGWVKAIQVAQSKHRGEILGVNQLELNQIQALPVGSIIEYLLPKDAITAEATKQLQESINAAGGNVHQGLVDYKHATGIGKQFDVNRGKQLQEIYDNNKIKTLETNFSSLTGTIGSAGSALMNFGVVLQGTPLEPFGRILMTVGSSLTSLVTALTTAKNSFLQQWAAAYQASIAHNAQAVSAFKAAIAEEGLSIATLKSAGAMGILGTAIWTTLWPLLAIAAAIGAVVLVAKGLDAAIETNKEQLEAATDAAAAASEAYDSAKQETSELSDAIEQVRTNEDAFDGLVIGTAAFNEQLVTANEQIMELIKKYPMLNDYLTTDKNGLMHISDEGLNAVKEYQKQRQANASALNLIQTADLNSVEAQQKAEQMRKTKGTDTLESLAQRRKEADLVEQQAEAQQQMAKLNAVNTALVDKEIGNREKVSAIIAEQYDVRKKAVNLEGESIHDLKQEYADFYGYKYDKSTKKLTDVEGNEIDVDNATIKDAVKEIRVITDIEVDAGSVDTAISSVDRKFSKYFKDSDFFSDILSSNIETNEDELRNLLQNPGQLQEIVSELSTSELAAILGVSADAVELDPGKYKNELIDTLTEKAENIAESQSEAWGEFGAMLAQAEGANADALLGGKGTGLNNIKGQLEDYTAEQRDLMLSIGKSLESSAGAESMKTFIRDASDIYRNGTEETINELNSLIEDVNWDSPIARLQAYKDLAASTTPQIKNMGEELLNSTESANLLGEAFEEFYNSSDWAEVAENMDSFVDSTGKLNAVGVEEMAKQCHSLNNLLDTGAISAGGVAVAINALGTDGELTLLDLNSTVLQLLSSFGQLDDIIGRAHNSIENFDWGLDTGESADFVKESAEKWNELYNGGEIGNPQLEAYAKYVLGEEKYIDLLASNSGNLQATMDEVSKYVNEYADGFDKAWGKLADGQWKGKVPKELQDLGISFGYDENGNWEWNPGTATTEELSEWLQAVKDIGPEMAAAMIEDWQNYSPNFRAERQKNDFYAGLDDYISSRGGKNGVTVTTSELETIAAATGQEVDEVKTAITEAAEQTGQKLTEIDNTVEGGLTTDQLNAQYTQAKTGGSKGSWIDQLITTKDGQKQVDANQAITQAISDGFTQTQAENMAYDELSKAVAEGTDVWYKDKLLTPEDLASFDNFKNAIADFEENSQWVEVGKAIAEGVVSYIKGETTPNTDNKPNNSSTTPTVIKPSQQDNKYTDTGTRGGNSGSELRGPGELTWQDKVPGWVSKLIEIYNNPPEPKSEPTELTPAQYQKMYGESQQATTEETNNTLTESGEAMGLAAISLTESGTNLTQASSELSSSAKELSAAADKLNTPDKEPGGTFTSGKVQTNSTEENVEGSININTTEADTKVTELQTKLKNLNDLINQGGTYTLNVSGIKDIKAAATAAKTLTKNSGTQTIGIKTGKADTSSVDSAKKTIGNTEAKIKVGANVDQATAAVRKLQRTINGMSAKLDVSINQTGNKTVNIIIKKSGSTVGTTSETIPGNAKGKNNHGIVAPPSFGSAARGKYGQVGPKGKGGLTLTGELGYEVAWLPDENRSMILGANGPQMINLPGNAVVWDHEQSKEILKRKAIPAGSHSTSTRPNSINGDYSVSQSTYQKAKDKSSSMAQQAAKEIIKITQKAGKVLVWWENAGHRMDKAQRDGDKAQKELEKLLKVFGVTVEDYKKAGEKYKTYLDQQMSIASEKEARANKELEMTDKGRGAVHTTKVDKAREKMQEAQAKYDKHKTKKNKKALASAKKSYQKAANSELTAVGARREISYEVTKTTTKKGKKKKQKVTKKTNVNLGNYIKTDDETGAYIINQKEIDKIANGYRNSKGKWVKGNKSKAEAIAKAAEDQLNDLLSKQKTAEDEKIKAEEALAEFYDTTYETFYSWDKVITEAYILGQQLEKLSNLRNIYSNVEDLEFAKLEAGFSSVTKSLPKITEALERNKNLMISQVKANSALVDATWSEYQDVMSLDTATKRYEANPESQQAANDYESAKITLEFLKSLGINTNDFNYQDAVNALNSNQWKEEDFNKIKDGLDKIAEKQGAYFNAIADTYSSMTEVYQTIEEYQSYMADFENSLINGLEEQTKKEIDKLSKLNDSLNNAAKDLIEEVKRKLDERRKQEDNKKTEQDISQKQQRLAALRADTSGGNQVAIAQLEKEIAEAQQSYGRTLEDQLIDRLSQQQDEAAKQREHQIQLLEAQIGFAAALGTNVEEINAWLEDPKKNQEQIRQAWLANNGYAEAGNKEKKQLEEAFNVAWGHYLAYDEVLPGLEELAQTYEEVSKPAITSPVESINKKMDKIIGLLDPSKAQAKESTPDTHNSQINSKAIDNFNKLRDSLIINPNINNYRDASVRIQQADAAWSALTSEEKALTEYNIRHTAWTNMNAAQQQAKLEEETRNAKLQVTNLQKQINSLESERRQKQSQLETIDNAIKRTSNSTQRISLITEKGSVQTRITSLNNEISRLQETINNLKAKYQFKKGGLASQTGPAWLDGTPSKPELVLNATDTKNFLVLRDVLAGVMKGVNSTSNTYGDTKYEININVDKVSNDYDVNKIADTVEKRIVQKAGYRNVTQVRNLR